MGSIASILTSGAEHSIAQAKIDNARKTQASGNLRSAAESSLARFTQSLSNSRQMKAAGEQVNAQTQNIARMTDQAVAGSAFQRLEAASALGEATAMAAAAGVGGSSIDTYKATMQLREAINQDAADQEIKANNINMSANKGAILEDAVASQNNNNIQTQLDYTEYVDHVKLKNKVGALVAVGVATYFGGAKAGMATADTIMAGNKYANADYQGGNALLTQAAGNYVGAAKDYQATSGGNTTGTRGTGLTVTSSSSAKGYWNTSQLGKGLNFNIGGK